MQAASNPQTEKHAHDWPRNQEGKPNRVHQRAEVTASRCGIGEHSFVDVDELAARFGHGTGQADRLFLFGSL